MIYPTESFYGLGADPRVPGAVEAVFRAKGRAGGLPLPLIAGGLEQVGQVAPGWERWPVARALAAAFWPGPLTLVLPGIGEMAAGVRAADGSVAIRWSSHPVAAALARALGFPLVGTSANASGEAPSTEVAVAARSLAARLEEHPEAGTGKQRLEKGASSEPGVVGRSPECAGAILLDGGSTPGGQPSTIVALAPEGPRILREGAISRRRLDLVLGEVRG